MDDQPWPWDEETMRRAEVRARRRAWGVAIVAACVMLSVLAYGVTLYPRLPSRLPLSLEGPSPTELRPADSWPKNPLTAFALLLFGAAFIVMSWKVEARRDWSRWPGWEQTQPLTRERKEYLSLPAREAWRWGGATVGIAMALTQIGEWDAALGRGTLMGFWPFVAGLLLVFVELTVGGIIASRRRKAALGSDYGRPGGW